MCNNRFKGSFRDRMATWWWLRQQCRPEHLPIISLQWSYWYIHASSADHLYVSSLVQDLLHNTLWFHQTWCEGRILLSSSHVKWIFLSRRHRVWQQTVKFYVHILNVHALFTNMNAFWLSFYFFVETGTDIYWTLWVITYDVKVILMMPYWTEF